MDNSLSQPQLKLPEIPSDIETILGTSKRDFVVGLWKLLANAQIVGLNDSGPQSYDINALTTQLNRVEEKANTIPKVRYILKDGVSNANITVGFDDIGTNNYFVDVMMLAADGDVNTVTWSVVEDSRKSNEVIIRIDGTAATYKFLVEITENKQA